MEKKTFFFRKKIYNVMLLGGIFYLVQLQFLHKIMWIILL